MSDNQNIWRSGSQDHGAFYYDERYDQIVYANGMRIARPPTLPRDNLIATGNQNYHQDYTPQHIHASNPGTFEYTPRTFSPYSNHAEPLPEASSPTRIYMHTPGRASGSGMEIQYPASHGFGTQTTSTYGVHAMPGVSVPPYAPYDLSTNLERAMTIGPSPSLPPHRPTVARVRWSSQGASVMQMYGTRSVVQPSDQGSPNTETTFLGNETSALPNPNDNPTPPNPSESPSTLNPKFKRAPKSKKFFVIGKVFITLWAEPAGDVSDSTHTVITDNISTGIFGEPVFSKIRRFVVVREGEQACSALPIITYGHQGVSKKGVKKSEHAIIYTGKKAPDPLPRELPARGERGLLPQSIRVDPDDQEHNVKVQSLGKVNRTSLQPLQYQFKAVWSKYFDGSQTQTQMQEPQLTRTIKVEASASCSKPELVTAFNALRGCGLTAEQARASLRDVGFHLSGPEFDEPNVVEDSEGQDVKSEHNYVEGDDGIDEESSDRPHALGTSTTTTKEPPS